MRCQHDINYLSSLRWFFCIYKLTLGARIGKEGVNLRVRWQIKFELPHFNNIDTFKMGKPLHLRFNMRIIVIIDYLISFTIKNSTYLFVTPLTQQSAIQILSVLQSILHNIFQIHNNVMWDRQYST